MMSPSGGSTLMTSAPWSANRCPQNGPAINCPTSTTRTPASAPPLELAPSISSGVALAVDGDEDCFRLHVPGQARFPDSALLLAGHRGFVHARRIVAIHVYLAGFDRSRHAERTINILCPN